MGAKHKRPFYVFAAVAAVCCLVLVSGVRGSKADDSRAPVVAGSQIADAGATISPLPGAPESSSPSSGPGASGGVGTGADGDFDASAPDLGGSQTGVRGGDAEAGSDSGVAVLPPFVVGPDDQTVPPPAIDDETDGTSRGGKRDRDKVKDDDGQPEDGQPDDEVEADPDVYGVDEDELEGADLDDPTGEATP